MRVLFIDSGIGGLSTLAETCKLSPKFNFVYFADDKYAPYGNKSKNFLRNRILSIIKSFNNKIDLVVLACNTATTNAIDFLRKHTQTKIIGTEPAIKVAANQSTNVLMIATPLTAKSKRLRVLSKQLNIKLKILALPHLAKHINDYYLQAKQHSLEKINKTINKIAKKAADCDTIVLGCTHYCLIKDKLANKTNATIIDGNFGVAKQVAQNVKHTGASFGQKQFIVSSGIVELEKKYAKIFKTLANSNDI